MPSLLERRVDGSIALFINNDLQFDSNDEHIYHEGLALPALAVALKRMPSDIRVLVIGGGDGLIAREMFKSARVKSLDLVDYAPDILALAGQDIAKLNGNSLLDPRINVHVEDAWEFVEDAQGPLFDVIVCDLTVAENVAEAKFHSVEWYAKLKRLLSDNGVLAINAVSPHLTPQAHWSIFNSVLQNGLHVRPYHVHIPSFTAMGYGKDWGFLLASPETIAQHELDELTLINPRKFLRDTTCVLKLFEFPKELFEYQSTAKPFLVGSDILLHYLNNGRELVAVSGTTSSSFELDYSKLVMLDPDDGSKILPPGLSNMLAESIYLQETFDTQEPQDAQFFLRRVLASMPLLQREQTSQLITDFLEEPAAFLKAIDLPGLISRLLKRAGELPSFLVAELELLREKLQDWAGDQLMVLALGRRIITILTLVIVIGNLLYPDIVYAKGGEHAAGGHHAGDHHGDHVGDRGRRGLGTGGGWVDNGVYVNRRRYWNGTRWIYPTGPVIEEVVPGQPIKKRLQNSLPQRNDISDSEYMDETGAIYPVRRYRMIHTSNPVKAVYRLGLETDILPNGEVAMLLTDSAYLLVSPHDTRVIDRKDGTAVMLLENDSAVIDLVKAEINRQHVLLSSANAIDNLTSEAVKSAFAYLSIAKELFGDTTAGASANHSQLTDRLEVFPGVYMTMKGKYLAVKRVGGQIVYLDNHNWYSDEGNTLLNEAYPSQFKSVVVSYLKKIVRETTATRSMLQADAQELTAYMSMLDNELNVYEESNDSMVNYGSRKLPRLEALEATQFSMRRTKHQIDSLEKHATQLLAHIDTAKTMLKNMGETYNV